MLLTNVNIARALKIKTLQIQTALETVQKYNNAANAVKVAH